MTHPDYLLLEEKTGLSARGHVCVPAKGATLGSAPTSRSEFRWKFDGLPDFFPYKTRLIGNQQTASPGVQKS